MKKLKKFTALATLIAMMSTSAGLNAECFRTDAGGYGYCETRAAPSLAPAIALGTIAIVAIIAVAVQNSSHSCHSHCH